MKTLNQKSTAVFQKLVNLLDDDGYAKINNAKEHFMPVIIEKIGVAPNFMGYCADIISMAHYYEQNGDLMADPEMTFFVVSVSKQFLVFPASYRLDGMGIFQESIQKINESWKFIRVMQKDHAVFANLWISNVKEQQNL